MSDIMQDERIVPTPHGFQLQKTEEYTVEVWRMIVNWRLVVFTDEISVHHGYCFFGTSLESLARAVAAGLEWEDPLNTDPPGFDKKAF